MESDLSEVSTLLNQMLNTMNEEQYNHKSSEDLLLKEIPSNAKNSDSVIKEFLHNVEFLYDLYVKNSSSDFKVNLNLKTGQLIDINRILHITNIVINSCDGLKTDYIKKAIIKKTPSYKKRLNKTDSDDLTAHATKSISSSNCSNKPSSTRNSSRVHFLNKKSIRKNDFIDQKISAISNDISFLHDMDFRQENKYVNGYKNCNKTIIPEKSKTEKKSILFTVYNDKNPYPYKNVSVKRKRKRSKYRLDRIHTKIKIMVNNYIHNNLMVAAKDDSIWLFKLPKDVLQQLKLQSNNILLNKPIKEIYSIDSINPNEIKRTNHNKNVIKECLSEEFQLYLNKKYRDIIVEYMSSADYTKDFEDLSQAHEPEYILLLKNTFAKACL